MKREKMKHAKKLIINNMAGLLAIITLGITAHASAQEQEFECVSPVQSAGDRTKLGKGDFSANILWKDIKLSPTSIGYGPSANHQYELSIIDGKVYMTQPQDKDKVLVRNDPKPEEGAAMIQVATAEAWGKSEVLDEINTLDDLNFELDQIVEDIECGESALIPFKIKGHASEVTWSMDTEKPREVTSKNQDVTIVGLYNKDQHKKYFIVPGYNIHAHVLMQPLNQAGHLRKINLQEGAQLYLPVKSK